jgi:hypothetical protein
VLPDRFIDHDSQAKQLVEARLTHKDIVATVLACLDATQPRVLTAR